MHAMRCTIYYESFENKLLEEFKHECNTALEEFKNIYYKEFDYSQIIIY